MAAEDNYICFVLHFSWKSSDKWLCELWNTILSVVNELGHSPTDLGLKKRGEVKAHPTWRYHPRNVKRLLETLHADGAEAVELYCTGAKRDLLMSPLCVGIYDESENWGGGLLFSQMMIDWAASHMAERVHRIVATFNKVLLIDYGLVHPMAGSKYPGLYFHGCAASTCLTATEEVNHRLWEQNQRRFREIMRGIYWGNLIAQGHWGGDEARRDQLVTQLREECEARISYLDSGSVFFTAPFSYLSVDPEKGPFAEYVEQVSQVLTRNGVEICGSR